MAIFGFSKKVFYPNGYRASIICNEYSYGGRDGLFEIAVLKGTEASNEICYETSVTNDVLGYVDLLEIPEILAKIEAL